MHVENCLSVMQTFDLAVQPSAQIFPIMSVGFTQPFAESWLRRRGSADWIA
jgi:hypothetical protein